ncbi:MAG: hypothetical protein Phog2KO_14760 [Phototrophicaceae bacterium]
MTNKPNIPINESQQSSTGMLPNMGGTELTSSRKLRYNSAIEGIDAQYADNDHVLLVYFPQRAEPFLFPDVDLIVIGRTGGVGVNLDTSPFQGRELGVSRIHAEISFDKGTYYVRDLRSTNGTWLNNDRLEPLVPQAISAGDQLRLGHCLTILYIKED